MRLRAGTRAASLALFCVLALVVAAPAQASRSLITAEALQVNPLSGSPPPDGQVEGACGIAPAASTLYVSEYYRDRVDLFVGGTFSSQLAAPNPADGVCGLALGSGRLYGNEWHEGVVRLLPSVQVFDSGHESTGVAVDAASNVYASDRTYVAVYQSSGAPVLHEGQPLKIGLNHLGDSYGIAVSGSRVYVADAVSDTVKVFEPAGDPSVPVAEISHGFTSLRDGALAVDPTNGHLLVLDNLQPGYEFPEAAIDEFDSNGTFLDHITALGKIVTGEPSGLAVDGSGHLFVTTGNGPGSNVIELGPYVAAGALASLQAVPASPPLRDAASAPVGGAPVSARAAAKRPGAQASEVVQHGRLRVAVQAKLTPKKLPRTGTVPVHFSLSATVASTDGSVPPQLRGIAIAINRNGRLDPGALPSCRIDQIQPSSSAGALEACGASLVGEGSFSAKVLLTQQAPFPSDGEVLAFNGSWHGRPAILAHIYGTKPVPTSYTLPFVITEAPKGAYGTTLRASLPHFTSKWGYVTGISLYLGRSTRAGGYLSAGCPAPKGFGAASFPLARASLSFGEGGPKDVSQTLTRSCGVR
jgi:DNA-binding beta-propeller fold protein YncE